MKDNYKGRLLIENNLFKCTYVRIFLCSLNRIVKEYETKREKQDKKFEYLFKPLFFFT